MTSSPTGRSSRPGMLHRLAAGVAHALVTLISLPFLLLMLPLFLPVIVLDWLTGLIRGDARGTFPTWRDDLEPELPHDASPEDERRALRETRANMAAQILELARSGAGSDAGGPGVSADVDLVLPPVTDAGHPVILRIDDPDDCYITVICPGGTGDWCFAAYDDPDPDGRILALAAATLRGEVERRRIGRRDHTLAYVPGSQAWLDIDARVLQPTW